MLQQKLKSNQLKLFFQSATEKFQLINFDHLMKQKYYKEIKNRQHIYITTIYFQHYVM